MVIAVALVALVLVLAMIGDRHDDPKGTPGMPADLRNRERRRNP
jgi:hypothetical protein